MFVGYDEKSEPKHAHKRSIYSQGTKFVQNIEGGNPKNTFNYLGGSNRLYVFEAPIDMLSLISLHKDRNWQAHNFVAMCGISSQPMLELIEKNPNIDSVVLCLDNDSAGQKASERFEKQLSEIGIKSSRYVSQNKDFNEDLLESKNEIKNDFVMGMG